MPSADEILVLILLDAFDGLLVVLKFRTFFDLVLVATTIALVLQARLTKKTEKGTTVSSNKSYL